MFSSTIFYSKLLLIFLWVFLASAIGFLECLLFFWDRDLQGRCARRIAWGILKVSGVSVEVDHPERLKRKDSTLYLANHQSAFDVGIFGIILPKNTVTIAKKEIIFVPLMGLLFVLTGGIRLNRSRRDRAISQLDSAVQKIRRKNISVIVMPEGTRNRGEKTLLPFKKGGFHLAVQAGIPMVPIVAEPFSHLINFSSRTLSPGKVRVKVLDEIGVSTESDVEALRQQARQQMENALKTF